MKEVYVIRSDKPLIDKSLRKNREYLAYFNDENLIVINDNNEQIEFNKNEINNIYFEVLETIDSKLAILSNNSISLNTKYIVYAKRNGNYNKFKIKQKDLLIVYLYENEDNKKTIIKIYKDNDFKTLDYKPEAFKDIFDIIWKEENVLYNQINKSKNVKILQNKEKFTIRIPYQLYTNSKFRNYYNKINTNGNKFNSTVTIKSLPNNENSFLEIKLEPKINNGKIVVTERNNSKKKYYNNNNNINEITKNVNKLVHYNSSGNVYKSNQVNQVNQVNLVKQVNQVNQVIPVKNKIQNSYKNNITYENKIQKAFQNLKNLGLKNFQNTSKKSNTSKLHALKQLNNQKLKELINSKYSNINAEGINNSKSSPEKFKKNKETRNEEKKAELNNLKALIKSIRNTNHI